MSEPDNIQDDSARNKFILIVDDEDAVRELLKDVLDDDGVTLLEAENGEDALTVVKSRHVDLVVTDLSMPGISGVELLTAIRENFPNMPVLVITGKPTLDAAVDCMKGGAIDFLTKPFDVAEFKAMVYDALAEEDLRQNRFANSASYHKLRTIAGYKVVCMLGEGTSGVVFKAVKDEQEYALKVFKFLTVTENRQLELKERFMREFQFLAEADHPGIVSVYNHGFSDSGIPYLVMKLLNGITLKEHIQKNDLTIEEKLSIMRQATEAISYIHDKQIIHRDIKPENIMVLDDGGAKKVVLTDFGIIRMQDSNLTMAANIMGSPAYLAPEGFSSSKVGPESDVFSLGVVLYELFYGRRPFQADDIYTMATVIQTELPPRPSSLDKNTMPELEDLLARSLQKKRADRLQSSAQFLAYIDHIIDPANNPLPDLPELNEPCWAVEEPV